MIDVLLEKADTVAPALAFCRYKRRKAVELKRLLSEFSGRYWLNMGGHHPTECAEHICRCLDNTIKDLDNSIKMIEGLK